MNVLVACEFSGVVRDAFRARGHNAWSCDLLDCEDGSAFHLHGDVSLWINRGPEIGHGWDLMIAHPPCTYLTVTGNRWNKPEYAARFPKRPEQIEDAVRFFMLLANAPIERIAIENPIGIMSTRWRKPDQIIQPFNYAAPTRKATCLWLKNLPVLLSFHRCRDEIITFKSGSTMSKLHYDTASLAPKERAYERSRTFPGIAKAMAEQWGSLDAARTGAPRRA